jgi:hypothetical protein
MTNDIHGTLCISLPCKDGRPLHGSEIFGGLFDLVVGHSFGDRDHQVRIGFASGVKRGGLTARASRFDGYQFTTYGMDQGLPHRAVYDL